MLIRNATLVDGTGAAPRLADVRTKGELIAEIGAAGTLVADADDTETIEARGLLLTPGFVDPHTHYDGQVTWDPILAPSSWHGVTTIVMGNCGVGFAPARREDRGRLIELMEGVEDIPGSALHEGIQWDWEGFPEYLDALEKLPRTLDIATQIPHGALRLFVMGERGARQETATPEDLDAMAMLVSEAVRAGALAFSTNRMPLHTSIDGEPVPGTFAEAEELERLSRAVVEGGGSVVQAIPAGAMAETHDGMLREIELYRAISERTGATFTFTLPQLHAYPDQWREAIAAVRDANSAGARLIPQVPGRANGLLLSWETFNPFMARPSYQEIASLPIEERILELTNPARRAKILSEAEHDNEAMNMMTSSLHSSFSMDDGPVFEPSYEKSIEGRAKAAGVDPLEMLYDAMCELALASSDGKTKMMAVFFAGYAEGNLDAIGEMMRDETSVISLGDGGAHCGMICDASLPTFVLAHWVRDRSRGERIPIEDAIKMLTLEPATAYGLNDRGVVAVGKRADLNLIDLEKIDLDLPEITPDLPTGATRIVQRGHGYRATVCAGEITFRDGEPTGQRPGRLVRGERLEPRA